MFSATAEVTTMSNAAERAKEILQNEKAPMQELKNLAKELKGDLEFGLARRLLAKAREQDPQDVESSQQLALCTYKDEELLPASRFATALSLLEEIGLRDPQNTNPETLALGGAVYKRMWEYGGQI